MKSLKLIVACLFLSSCAPKGFVAAHLAAQAAENVGCKLAQSAMWDSLQETAETGADFPDSQTLRTELVKAGAAHGYTSAKYQNYVDAYIANYEKIVGSIQTRFAPNSKEAWQKALAELETGVQPTDAHAEIQTQLKTTSLRLASADTAMSVSCANPAADQDEPVTHAAPATSGGWEQLKTSVAPEVFGARKVLAIAYQSCDAVNLLPIDKSVPNVQGIKDLGARKDGGHIREIASLALVNATDYYIHNQNLASNSCFEVRNSPLIYNFGGKPVVTSKLPYQLDIFTRSSAGGPTLGIDCSGYVFSALALAGLKLDPNKTLKANQVLAYGSVAFKEPQKNGMGCLNKISVSKAASILAGDIVAINGHVIMIDAIGADPFALNAITSSSKCTATNIHPENFDFTIAQSAPIRNGIGINRVQASNYMPESATIRNGFVAYAVASCRAKFGLAANLNSPDLSIVRHSKTKACMAAAPLTMTHESCVSSCQPSAGNSGST